MRAKAAQNWNLPLLLNRKQKTAQGLFIGALAILMYLASNHFPIFVPTILPFTVVDRSIDFIPWTVWVYFSAFLLIAYPYFVQRNLKEAQRYLYSFLLLAIMSTVVFLLCPTAYPRSDFPLPVDADTLSGALITWMRHTDSQNNCSPSLHVSASTLAALCAWSQNKRNSRGIFFFIWAAVVSFSTMSTKQHYFFDVITGFALGAFVYGYFFTRISIERNTKLSWREIKSKLQAV